jgi:hypothetical protein
LLQSIRPIETNRHAFLLRHWDMEGRAAFR